MNIGVSEVDKVVQQNAANAEESASAAEELSSHAGEMERVAMTIAGMVGKIGTTTVKVKKSARQEFDSGHAQK